MKLQSDGLHDALQGNLDGIVFRQLCGGLAVAIAAVNAVVLGQNAQKLQTVLIDLFLDACIDLTGRCPVDDQTHTGRLQRHLTDKLGHSCCRLDAPAGTVRDQKHRIHMGQCATGHVLQTGFVIHYYIAVVLGVLFLDEHLGVRTVIGIAIIMVAVMMVVTHQKTRKHV